jgi:hypothetical protein
MPAFRLDSIFLSGQDIVSRPVTTVSRSRAVGSLGTLLQQRTLRTQLRLTHNGLSDDDDTGNRFGTRDDPSELAHHPAAGGGRACSGTGGVESGLPRARAAESP